MPTTNPDLHGNVPDSSPVALLLIDVINDLEFEEGDAIVQPAIAMAHRIAALKQRARQAGIPTIYVNDNFGRWKSDFSSVVEHCLHDGVRGEPLARILRPEKDDYFVLKPKHSAFYGTTLDILLRYLGAETLILAGIAGNICILFSANDAYMRDFRLIVPSDCTVSNTADENEAALRQMRAALKADTTESESLDLQRLATRGRQRTIPEASP